MVDLAGVPGAGRRRRAEHLLVGAGGHCTYNPEPIADFLDFVVLGDGEEVVGEITEVAGAWKAPPAAPSGTRLDACAPWPASPASTCPSLYEVAYAATARLRRHPPRYPDAPDAGREAHRRRPGRLALPQATSSCRSPRWSTTGSTSRCSGAAPGAAASARRG